MVPSTPSIKFVWYLTVRLRSGELNEQLLQGPDLTSTLTGVIMRFHQEPVTIMADVEAMFHQVKVPSEDADLFRFL